MSILKLENVVKNYDKHIAVNDVSFEVPKGSVFGLLGPNGAGKTSLIRIITTITGADQGTVYLDGKKIDSDAPSQIGYMPEERGLYKKMKVGEHLMYLAQLKGLSKKKAKEQIDHWFNKFEITDWWDKAVEELSKGMQQKIQFIATVIHQPKLLILDEPFSGLDPINTNLIKAEIDEMHRNGTSIIFSTHRMEQVEEVCEHIVLINQGKKILEGEVSAIKDQFKENLFSIKYTGELPPDINSLTDADDSFKIVAQKEGEITVKVATADASNTLLSHLMNRGVHITSFQEILPTLNEIFIKQIGEV